MCLCIRLLIISICRSSEKNADKKHEEHALLLKYIKNHVRDLFHIPMAILIKSAAVLTEDLFIEAIPAAWELLLEKNQVRTV